MRTGWICVISVTCVSWFFACSGGESGGDESGGAGTGPDTGGVESTGGAGATSAAAGNGASAATPSGGNDASGGATSAGGSTATGGDTGTGGSSGSGATSAAGGASGGEPAVDAGWPDVVFSYDAGDTGAPDACASTTVTAEPVPLDLVVILDASGSMVQPGWDYGDRDSADADCNIDDTIVDSKWCKAINALMDFFEAPTSIGTGVAFRTYTGSQRESDCGAYDSLDVDWGIFQGGADDPLLLALEAEMNAQAPGDRTPTERALETIVTYTLARQQANEQSGDSNRKVIGILVTDGEPTTCDTDTANLNQIVVDHYQATEIPTFFIGMTGADYAGLDEMAQNAGAEQHTDGCNDEATPCSYHDVGDGNGTVLSDTLELIRQSVIGCQFAVPTTDLGLVDLDSINVQFTPGEGLPAENLPWTLGGEANCADSPGYYTDDDANPTTILLCPETCTRAEADPTSSVNIELLCEGS